MEENKKELETLQDIRNIMERSSRFLSLSGWSGIGAGCCALVGASFAYPIVANRVERANFYTPHELKLLLLIAAVTFVAALFFGFIFTYLRSQKTGIPIWGSTSKRLLWSVGVPLFAGGLFLLRLISLGYFGVIAPGCLIIYGIALFSGSKQTLDEIRYLGYAEILLGFIALCFLGYGLIFWTIGFGLLHILYGIWMWWKYERK